MVEEVGGDHQSDDSIDSFDNISVYSNSSYMSDGEFDYISMVNDHCDKVLNLKLSPGSMHHKSSFSVATKLRIKGSSYASPSSIAPPEVSQEKREDAIKDDVEEEVVDTGFFAKRSSSLIDFSVGKKYNKKFF